MLEWAPPALLRADLRISAQVLEIGSGVNIYTTAIGKCYITSKWMNWDCSPGVTLQHVLRT